MKKLMLATVMLLVAASTAMAQQTRVQSVRTGTINGGAVDDATVAGLEGAVVEFRSVADTTVVLRATSMPDGKFTLRDVPYGEWSIDVSYLGYQGYRSKLTVNSRNMNIAPFYMTQITNDAGEVTVVGQALRVSVHGDTLVYNPKAFRVPDDADAEAILKQLPGVEVKDGGVKVQGRDVGRILVDGKETYGTNVTETMRTIPANMLEKIEVFDKLSDFAETTGIDDGDDYTVMNFVTGIKFAHFGDFGGLWGLEDWYSVEARYNVVTGGHRFGINGSTNNTGGGSSAIEGGTAIPGMFGGGGYSGRYGGKGGGRSDGNKMRAVNSGLTYNFEPSDNFRVNANYTYGLSESTTLSETETRYFNYDQYDRQFRTSLNDNSSNRHNFEGNARWKIAKGHNLNLRLSGNVSDSDGGGFSEESSFEEGIEKVVQYFMNDSHNNRGSYNLSGQVNYGMRVDEHGRSLRFGLNGRLQNSDGDTWSDNHRIRNMGDLRPIDSLGRSRSNNDSKGHSLQGRMEYFEPLSPYLHATVSYEARYNYDDRQSNAERWDYPYIYGDPDQEGSFASGEWVEWNEGSNIMSSETWSHRVGPGINYKKNNDELRIDAVYKYTNIMGERLRPQPTYNSSATFNNFVYEVEYQNQFRPQTFFSIDFESDTDNPSITQLQDVDDISSDGQYVSGGNSSLKPYYTYQSSARFTSFNLRNSASFNIGLNGEMTSGSIGSDRIMVDEDGMLSPNGTLLVAGQQYSRPINIDRGIWSVGLYASWGRPLKFIKTNFNFSVNANYTERPGMINGQENTSKQQSYSLSLYLNSNFSENFILGGNYAFSPSFVTNTNREYADAASNGISQTAGFNLYWRTWKDFVLRADLMYSYQRTRQDNFADDYVYDRLQGNVSLGKKVFRNKRGEVALSVIDLFNQNKLHNQSVDVDRIVYTNDTSIGRYFSLSFRYQLRNFSREEPEGGPGRGGRRRGGFGKF